MKKKIINRYKIKSELVTNKNIIENYEDAILNKNEWLDEWIANVTNIFKLCEVRRKCSTKCSAFVVFGKHSNLCIFMHPYDEFSNKQ